MIFHGIWTSIAKKPFSFVLFFWGGGGGGGGLGAGVPDHLPPLWIRTWFQGLARIWNLNMLQVKLLNIPECENRGADQNACLPMLVCIFVVCMQQIQVFMHQSPYEL